MRILIRKSIKIAIIELSNLCLYAFTIQPYDSRSSMSLISLLKTFNVRLSCTLQLIKRILRFLTNLPNTGTQRKVQFNYEH